MSITPAPGALTRRAFVRAATVGSAAVALPSVASTTDSSGRSAIGQPPSARAHWLEGSPRSPVGARWGMAWPRGTVAPGVTFGARTDDGTPVSLQSWPLATWPDGSVKWSGHAVSADAPSFRSLTVQAGELPVAPAAPVSVVTTDETIDLTTGDFSCRVQRRGRVIVARLRRGATDVAVDGRLVCVREEESATGPEGGVRRVEWEGEVTAAAVEQAGPVRAVVRLEGRHVDPAGARRWLPFVVRLSLHAGASDLRWIHTFIYEGDPARDRIAGLGVRFDVPQRGPLHDRHIRFSGEDDGLFAEAVRGVTGLRRDPGAAVRRAQLAGERTPEVATWDRRVASRIHYIPAFGDWTLFQSSADGFEVLKRTNRSHTWLSCARGNRAGGLMSLSSPEGGIALGIRDFWQSHPAQLDVRGAAGDGATVTAWLWAPQAAAMDLRPYHDGVGQDTYARQLEGLEVTYEDYEPGFDSPVGVARTSELSVWALARTPTREGLAAMAATVRIPPRLLADRRDLHRAGVFGGLWSPQEEVGSPAQAIDRQLASHFDFYLSQREQRRWYGFWNYGDVMHSYDADRHEWKYDIGGFAWDNSELSTDIWLWLYFLRSGRPDVFRFAEAMTRHTGEVDVHHLGPFAPLGSRHNVLHWGCSAKQLRISTAANRRYYYYLTGDERTGDLLREQVEAIRTLATVQPSRKVAASLVTPADPLAKEAYASFGLDWGAAAAAWLTEWERTGSAVSRDRLLAGMRGIGAQPWGFFSLGALIHFETGAFRASPSKDPSASHLSAAFGLVEVCVELVELLDVPEFRNAWLEYCRLYNADPSEQSARLGRALKGRNLEQGHARLTAFAAKSLADADLARRAWQEFRRGENGWRSHEPLVQRRIEGPAVLRPVEEAAGFSTNAAAQWGLAAIQCLALLGEPPEVAAETDGRQPTAGGGR